MVNKLNNIKNFIADMQEKYSIWALPEELIEQELQAIIILLSSMYGSSLFQPHLTLIGTVKRNKEQMIEVVNKLADNLNEFKLKLGEISFSTTFFQSVFVRVLATTQLMNLNLKAKQLLGLENNAFMPHISLLYGSHDMATREEAVKYVQLSNTNYYVNRLVLVSTTGEPSEWNILYQVKIGTK